MVCFCGYPSWEENNNVNVYIPLRVEDEEYLRLVNEGSFSRVKAFQPEMLFWNWVMTELKGNMGILD